MPKQSARLAEIDAEVEQLTRDVADFQKFRAMECARKLHRRAELLEEREDIIHSIQSGENEKIATAHSLAGMQ
ncbi:hypothetical protein ABEW34_01800 [Paenibacillus algorifonticola]|uniref:hypothetical protein n=1 Tax=Paenibacillus algorifonticola TaxID=684063 RepID=UPI003D286ACF